MARSEFSLLCIGNALVDILSKTDDAFLTQEDIAKSAMVLIEEDRAADLFQKMTNRTVASGGSAANTIAGFASFGGSAAFIGRVADDELGANFKHDMETLGITCATTSVQDGPSTGRCYIFVTPDAERSMNTYLGASVDLNEKDIDEKLIKQSEIIYLEGYLFDKEPAKNAYFQASQIAANAGKQVALTLSDTFCVERHRNDFIELIHSQVDILFANEHEIAALYPDLSEEEIMVEVQQNVGITAITRGEKGATIVSGRDVLDIPTVQVKNIVDTTGAGDQFAAGFLYGLSSNKTLSECANIGHLAAGEVISHMGPRPQIELATLLDKAA